MGSMPHSNSNCRKPVLPRAWFCIKMAWSRLLDGLNERSIATAVGRSGSTDKVSRCWTKTKSRLFIDLAWRAWLVGQSKWRALIRSRATSARISPRRFCYRPGGRCRRSRARPVRPTWFYRVALQTAMNWQRKDKPRRARQQPLVEVQVLATDGADSAEQAEQRETVEQLYEAIHQLPKADAALVLLYLDEMSYREMAEVLGISESNVGVKLNRAKKALSALMNGKLTWTLIVIKKPGTPSRRRRA